MASPNIVLPTTVNMLSVLNKYMFDQRRKGITPVVDALPLRDRARMMVTESSVIVFNVGE